MLVLWWINLRWGGHFCKHIDFNLELLLHQCFTSPNYYFTNASYPDFITSPVLLSRALSLYQHNVPGCHFTNAPYASIMTFTKASYPDLVMSLNSMLWYYHFTNYLCPGFSTLPKLRTQTLSLHQRFTPLYYHSTLFRYPPTCTT
jgi:hypothetical protein